MARPSLLSDERRERIERELADGIPVAVVAQKAHVSRTTLFEWIAKGYVVRKRKRDPLELVHESPAERETAPSLDQRLAEAEPGLFRSARRSASRPAPRARTRSAWRPAAATFSSSTAGM
jgi:hypothetical protein